MLDQVQVILEDLEVLLGVSELFHPELPNLASDLWVRRHYLVESLGEGQLSLLEFDHGLVVSFSHVC